MAGQCVIPQDLQAKIEGPVAQRGLIFRPDRFGPGRVVRTEPSEQGHPEKVLRTNVRRSLSLLKKLFSDGTERAGISFGHMLQQYRPECLTGGQILETAEASGCRQDCLGVTLREIRQYLDGNPGEGIWLVALWRLATVGDNLEASPQECIGQCCR